MAPQVLLIAALNRGYLASLSRCSLRRDNHQTAKVTSDTIRIIIVARALILGDTPKRTELNTSIGKVVAPGPETKLAMTTSSKDKVKDNNQAETKAGIMIGKVTWIKAFRGVAPKSIAASK